MRDTTIWQFLHTLLTFKNRGTFRGSTYNYVGVCIFLGQFNKTMHQFFCLPCFAKPATKKVYMNWNGIQGITRTFDAKSGGLLVLATNWANVLLNLGWARNSIPWSPHFQQRELKSPGLGKAQRYSEGMKWYCITLLQYNWPKIGRYRCKYNSKI